MSNGRSEGASQRREFIAVCETCGINTEDRHTESSARVLCARHNINRGGCDAKPVPVCWVCHEPATHQDTNPPYSYVCETHAISIDEVPIEEAT